MANRGNRKQLSSRTTVQPFGDANGLPSPTLFDFAAEAHKRRGGKPARQFEPFSTIPREFQVGKTTAYELIHEGVLPKPYLIGKRAKRFDRDELDIAHERLRARQTRMQDGSSK